MNTKSINYLKQTLIYASGNLIKNLFFFLLVPLFTFKFTPSEYAIYSIISIFISFLNVIYLLGMQESFYSYFHHKKTPEYRFSFITTVYIALILSASIFSILIYHYREILSVMILKSKDYANLFAIVGLILWFNSFFSITQSFLNIIEKSTSFVINKFISIASLFFFYGYGYISNSFTLANVFKWILYTAIITFVSSSYFVVKILYRLSLKAKSRKYFSFEIIKNSIVFGLPMVPGTLALLIMALSDRYLISILSEGGLNDAGIYAISYKIGLTVSFLTSLFSLVYLPYAMKIAKKRYAKSVYSRMYDYYLILGTIISVGVILFSSEIYRIFINQKYYGGMKIVFFGVLSSFLIGIFYLINIAFYNIKKSKYIALTIVFGAVLNIVLNIITIPKYGIYGAGFSSIFSYLVIVIIHFFNSKKYYDLGYKFSHFLYAILIVSIAAALNFILPETVFMAFLKFSIYMIVLYYILIKKRVIKNLIKWIS